MINRLITFLILLFGISVYSSAQSKYELFGGVSISNTGTYTNGNQHVNINPDGSPDYAMRYHIGIQRSIVEFSNLKVQLGFSVANRGSKNTYWIIWPRDTLEDVNLIYIQTPINFNFRLLNNKEYYFVFGLTPSYLLLKYDNIEKELSTPNTALEVPWQLEYKLGIKMPIYKNIQGMASFNRSLFSFNKRSIFNRPTWKVTELHHTFDLTLIYKI